MPTILKVKFILVVCCLSIIAQAQQKFSLSGYLTDARTGEALIGANVVIPDLQTGASTNSYGYFSLSIPSGTYKVNFQYIGYNTVSQNLTLNADKSISIELTESSTQLTEVQVTDERMDKNVTSLEMSVAKLDVKEIQKIPQLLGETDIIRTLTLLPGITTVGEGASGFNVRGGAADQNLILLDEAPVYNSSHLFGFFSIFNADAVKDVKVYKGGIPANYGGRLSSVIDVRQKEGNLKEFHGQGGIGLLSSRALVEGPIKKDKSSFIVAARRSYLDIFLRMSNDPEINQNILYFYDLNAKINWKISDRDRIYLSGYFGRDVFGIRNLFGFDWGNGTASIRWNHLFSSKLFANLTAVYSDYTYTIGTPEEDEDNSFRLTSRIQDIHLKGDFNYFINSDNKIDFGAELVDYRFSPGRVETNLQDDPIQLQKEYGLEPSVYFSHEYKPGLRWTLKYGLRYSSFYKLGSQKVVLYQSNNFPQREQATDTTQYGHNDLIAQYDGWQGFEPRLAVNYLLSDYQSLKFSFNRTRQYIQLISNTTSPTPVDLYRPAGEYIRPATVYQYAGGYFHNFNDNAFEASVELYYKDFEDLIDYRDGADLIFQEHIETEILRGGIGRSYGLEFLLRKQKGKLTGWIGYTLSRSERKLNGPSADTRINNGKWYLSNWDKPHDLSLVANYQLNEKWSLGAIFIYQTGRPFTPPEGKYHYEEFVVPIYTKRNSDRVPDYHRADISATYTPKPKSKKFSSSWNFGIYNVYARRNPYSVFVQSVSTAGNAVDLGQQNNFFDTQGVRLSLFATAIPFVTWNFKF